MSTGSPLAPASFDYVYNAIGEDLQLSSIAGGTDILGCFALGNSLLPVRRGELQCRGLGMAVEIWDEELRGGFAPATMADYAMVEERAVLRALK